MSTSHWRPRRKKGSLWPENGAARQQAWRARALGHHAAGDADPCDARVLNCLSGTGSTHTHTQKKTWLETIVNIQGLFQVQLGNVPLGHLIKGESAYLLTPRRGPRLDRLARVTAQWAGVALVPVPASVHAALSSLVHAQPP